MFADMMKRIQGNVVTKLFRIEYKKEDTAVPAVRETKLKQGRQAGCGRQDRRRGGRRCEREVGGATRGPGGTARADGADDDGADKQPTRRDRPQGRPQRPVPVCGSGKKYKKCHGKDDEAAAEG